MQNLEKFIFRKETLFILFLITSLLIQLNEKKFNRLEKELNDLKKEKEDENLSNLLLKEDKDIKKNQNKITELKGIEAIINPMNKFVDNEKIQENGLGALINIVLNEENQNKITELKGIETIINAINKFPNNKEIQKKGIGTLRNIALNEVLNEKFNRLEKELNDLKKEKEDENLSNLLLKEDKNIKKNQNKITELKGIEAIINPMNKFDNQNKITELKGIETIINPMNNFPNHKEIQANGLRALANIASSNNEENQNKITELKGIETIINAMNNFPNHKEIQANGLRALWNIASNENG
ncbi:aardvark [Anaeramoeba ignava]|uniref:Aardvark n=1 Tax=Anaeramoeba ignava TaxID=1746090 RepID=A0A9Q0LC12_ANAIG|nr:aardvark [Anaeramoeba ignava]